VTEKIFEARDLVLGYNGKPILRDLTLEVRSGEFWFLIGPNGSGKTTLLRAILHDLQPLGGELRSHPELARPDRIGFVPQRCELNAALPTTVREFVLLGLVGMKLPRNAMRERLAAALERAGLGGMEDRDYWSISGGQRQRALLARALVRQPHVLILDEATNGLDLASEHAILGLLRRLNREEGVTVIFVTHDLELPARYATHVVLFHDGTGEGGALAEVLTEERLMRAYRVPVRVSGSTPGTIDVHVVGGPET
jgi:ABC-type Mn2+/Zn2+ transport system ATPase subunit